MSETNIVRKPRKRNEIPEELRELKKAIAVALRADWRARKVVQNPGAKLANLHEGLKAWGQVLVKLNGRIDGLKAVTRATLLSFDPDALEKPPATPEEAYVVAAALNGA
jgi:hypothetical protein